MAIKNKNILLILLPFWDPQVPPLGIACLKSFVEKKSDYSVKLVDANVEFVFRNIYSKYFNNLQNIIPEEKRRHLYNIGHEILKHHMMAFINCINRDDYIDLIRILVQNTFFSIISINEALILDQIINDFYKELKKYSVSLINKYEPSIIGLSVYNGTLPASMFLFQIIKELNPEIKTIMGGSIFASDLAIGSPNYEIFIKNSQNIDNIIIGEGEQLFLKLLQGELLSKKKILTSSDILNSTIDLNTSVVPDFSDYNLDAYLHLASFTSRSCPFECNFCVETIFWGKYRKKDEVIIASELSELHYTYNKQLFVMCDSILNPVVDKLTKELYSRKIPVYFDGYFRIDKNSQIIDKVLSWRKGGFYRARLGIESGSQEILDAMNKNISIQEIIDAIKNLAYAGIKTSTMWVIGYPGETECDFEKTLKLIEELKDYIYEADCNPFWYFYTGQGNSDKWSIYRKLLYPEKYSEMLLLQTWTLDIAPTREIAYERVNRFIDFCAKLKIPNPYNLSEINIADERWKKLSKNSVPSILDFESKNVTIDERVKIKEPNYAKPIDDIEWNL